MKYTIVILILISSLKGFSQNDTIQKNVIIKPYSIRLGRPNTEKEQPLFFLDGIIINSSEFQKLKPETIESITILKDSAAAALFSTRGNNGVIIIKTKKLSKRELRKMKKKDS